MHSRKPSRTLGYARCANCHQRQELCLCQWLPRLELQTKLVILMHSLEKKSTTNTGRIAQLAIPASELRIWGRHGEAMRADGFETNNRKALVLFPSGGAEELTQDFVSKLYQPVTLLVPDATWRQAAKMVRRIPELKSLTRVKLPEANRLPYRLRRSVNESSVSTLEAIARALGVLEGAHVQEQLEAIYRRMAIGTLISRGQIPRKSAPSLQEHCHSP